MGHSVSDAAARSVRKSEAVKLAERTHEQIIADIRTSLASKLAVTPNDTRYLLQHYDDVKMLLNQSTLLLASGTKTIEALGAEIDELKAKNEEFREIYEQENRRGEVTILEPVYEQENRRGEVTIPVVVPVSVPTESGG
jgi:hypothetical protein